MRRRSNGKIKNDILTLIVSIAITIFIVRSGLFEIFFGRTEEFRIISSFIAGLFFTSMFTIAPASLALAGIMQSTPVLLVALVGGFGAMVGDLIIFCFMRDHVAEDIVELTRSSRYKKIRLIFHKKIFRWLTPFLGALVIASPLPDELGIAMMGFSKMRLALLLPISFIMNALGIVLLSGIIGLFGS